MILFFLLTCSWALFAADFIIRTSHVSIDGTRYFSVFDDGMISMRYAKNLVEHHELVWNLGDRVEGFSNPLWTFLMAAAIAVFGAHYAPLVVQILGALVCAAILWIFSRAATRNRSSGLALVAGTFLLVFSYPLSYWSLSGMEAGAVCLVFTVALGAQYAYEKGVRENPLLLHGCLIAIAYCLRPDGWLAISPFFVACWIDSVRQRQFLRAAYAVTIPIAAVAAVLCSRRIYYGELVPNTYVLKVEGYALSLRLSNGISFVRQFWRENYPLFALTVLAAIYKRRVAVLNLMAAIVVLAYQVYVGGDPWLYWRQLLPIYPAAAFAILFIFDGMQELAPAVQALHPPRWVAYPLAVAVVCAWVIALGFPLLFVGKPWINAREAIPFYLVMLFAIFSALDYSSALVPSASESPWPASEVRLVTLAIFCISLVTIAYLLYISASPRPYWEALLPYVAGVALLLLVGLRVQGRLAIVRRYSRSLQYAAVAVIFIMIVGAVGLGEERFLRELAGKPSSYDLQAKLIDKAVLASKLFGPGKTHHVVWGGTYPYYIDGRIIDALGKSDKQIARAVVDESVAFRGMRGVPGHAKHDFRDTILGRKPDVIADYAGWGNDNMTSQIAKSYTLITLNGVSLCVKNEMAAQLKGTMNRTCPYNFLGDSL